MVSGFQVLGLGICDIVWMWTCDFVLEVINSEWRLSIWILPRFCVCGRAVELPVVSKKKETKMWKALEAFIDFVILLGRLAIHRT